MILFLSFRNILIMIYNIYVEESNKLLSKYSFDKLSSFYFIFSDSTRLKIIFLLINSNLSVNSMSKILGVSNSLISHQLAILKNKDIITFTRDGKSKIYSLTDNHIKEVFEIGLEHIAEQDEKIRKDLETISSKI